MNKRIESVADLAHEARNFLQILEKDPHKATLITLSGELGAGKTAFAKAVALALGVKESVTSPTFVLEKIYALPAPSCGFSRLVHIDAYRLKGGSELAALGFDEALTDSGNLILLEWPEHVADKQLTPAAHLSLVVNEDGSRTLSYD